jgi:hypothetical protein
MSHVTPLHSRLAPDCIYRLERAARERFVDADRLKKQNRFLTALYLYGYSVEMSVSAAYFRSSGISPNAIIDRDLRQRRMAQARLLKDEKGESIMNSDPHPVNGWARFLRWNRKLQNITSATTSLLEEAVRKADQAYRHWRPELRYKISQMNPKQLEEVRNAADWFIKFHGRL